MIWRTLKPAFRQVWFNWFYNSFLYRWQQRRWTKQFEKGTGQSMQEHLAIDDWIERYHFAKAPDGEIMWIIDETKVGKLIHEHNMVWLDEMEKRMVMELCGVPLSAQAPGMDNFANMKEKGGD